LKTFVVDASVGIKWLLPPKDEPFTTEAKQLLHLFVTDRVKLLVPDLFWTEVGAVLWKAVLRGRISAESAERALDRGVAFKVPCLPAIPLVVRALQLALTYQRSVYDSLYVATAIHAKAELVTADEKLVNALGTKLPVRWLGALSTLL